MSWFWTKKFQLQGRKEHVGAPAAKCLQSIKHNVHLGWGGCEVLQFISEHSCTWNGDPTFWDGFGACGTGGTSGCTVLGTQMLPKGNCAP